MNNNILIEDLFLYLHQEYFSSNDAINYLINKLYCISCDEKFQKYNKFINKEFSLDEDVITIKDKENIVAKRNLSYDDICLYIILMVIIDLHEYNCINFVKNGEEIMSVVNEAFSILCDMIFPCQDKFFDYDMNTIKYYIEVLFKK